MKYPNLRYGNPTEFRHYAQGIPTKTLARRLRRTERTVQDWLDGKKRIPFWVPELMRLQHQETQERLRQMRMHHTFMRLGIVTDRGTLYEFEPKPTNTPQDAKIAPANLKRQHFG